MRSILYQFLAHVSLKKKIIFGFLSVSILCLIALSFMSYQDMRKIMNVQIESQAEDTVNLICASFDSNLSLIIDRYNMLTFDSQFQEYLQMDEDAALILDVLDEYEGALPFSDKASPEVIAREFGMSKAAFKRAVGRLLKQGKIRITENRILRNGDEEENENG